MGCVISVTRADSATPKITKSQNHAITGGGGSVISATGCDKEIKEVKEIKEIKDNSLKSLNSLNSLNSLTSPTSLSLPNRYNRPLLTAPCSA